MTESDYQKQMVQYQTMNLIRTTIIQSLIPMLMFVSFVFLPMGIGFAVMAAVLALAIVSHLYIEKEFGAEKTKFSEFDNDDYDEFCDAPTRWVETHSKSQHAFFQSNKQKGKNVEEDNLELVPLLRRLKLD